MIKVKKMLLFLSIFFISIFVFGCNSITFVSSDSINDAKGPTDIDIETLNCEDESFDKFTSRLKRYTNVESIVKEIGLYYEDATVIVENFKYSNYKYEKNCFGSGFVYKKTKLDNGNIKYYVMTNKHVTEKGSAYKIKTNDDEYIANFIGESENYDVAILYFVVDCDSKDKINVGKILFNENAYKGQSVIAIGTPKDYQYFNTLTVGRISNILSNEYLHTAFINSGNSGGPLIVLNGYVVGLNRAKIVNENEEKAMIEGMFVAIKNDKLQNALLELNDIKEHERITFGISLCNVETVLKTTEVYYGDAVKKNPLLTEEDYAYFLELKKYIPADLKTGTIITDVCAGSYASKFGFLKGDIVTKINDTEVATGFGLFVKLYNLEKGETLKLSLIRDGVLKVALITI